MIATIVLGAMNAFFLLQVQPSEMPSKTRTAVTDTLSVDTEGDAAVQHQETSDQAAASKAWPQRFTIVGLCFFAFMLCNMDRVNMSIAVLPMQQQYGWNSQTLGIVQSSFFWYASLLSCSCATASGCLQRCALACRTYNKSFGMNSPHPKLHLRSHMHTSVQGVPVDSGCRRHCC